MDGPGLQALMNRFEQADAAEFPLLYHIFFEQPPGPAADGALAQVDVFHSEAKAGGKLVICRSTSSAPLTYSLTFIC